MDIRLNIGFVLMLVSSEMPNKQNYLFQLSFCEASYVFINKLDHLFVIQVAGRSLTEGE